jgi:hypothetical protein
MPEVQQTESVPTLCSGVATITAARDAYNEAVIALNTAILSTEYASRNDRDIVGDAICAFTSAIDRIIVTLSALALDAAFGNADDVDYPLYRQWLIHNRIGDAT